MTDTGNLEVKTDARAVRGGNGYGMNTAGAAPCRLRNIKGRAP